jgi:hypothetical protein
MVPAALGALVTLVGGALALVPPPARNDRSAVAGPVALFLATSGAVVWGIYAAAIAPELALGGSPLAAIVRLPGLVLGARGRLLALLALVALAFVLLAVAAAARSRLAALAGPAPGFWAGVVIVAAALALSVSDPWWLLLFALGLAAAAVAPMRLATSPAGAVAGGVVGALAFVVLAALPLLAPGAPAWLGSFSRYPALLAMPLGLMAARLPGRAERPASTRRRQAGAERVEETAPVA